MITPFHVFYIPVIFILGLLAGAAIGRRNALRELAAKERADREREERRRARTGQDDAT